ncbi:MAG: ester cyclase [Chloroflexi bacterium]|nr:ester cyclase [Chloroflexota bacterium]
MSIDENKAIVRRFIDEVFVQGMTDTVDELIADDFVGHTWPSTGRPKDDLKAAIGRTSKALTDARFTIEDMVAEDDRVAVRLTAEATHTGELMGMAPSGKRYSIGEIHIFRIHDGTVVEHWHQYDKMTMMQQLGALPGGEETAPDSTGAAPDADGPAAG